MKFLHTSDWHIGSTLNGFSLLEEQKYAFEQILSLAKQNQVDGIIQSDAERDEYYRKVSYLYDFRES